MLIFAVICSPRTNCLIFLNIIGMMLFMFLLANPWMETDTVRQTAMWPSFLQQAMALAGLVFLGYENCERSKV